MLLCHIKSHESMTSGGSATLSSDLSHIRHTTVTSCASKPRTSQGPSSTRGNCNGSLSHHHCIFCQATTGLVHPPLAEENSGIQRLNDRQTVSRAVGSWQGSMQPSRTKNPVRAEAGGEQAEKMWPLPPAWPEVELSATLCKSACGGEQRHVISLTMTSTHKHGTAEESKSKGMRK